MVVSPGSHAYSGETQVADAQATEGCAVEVVAILKTVRWHPTWHEMATGAILR